VVDYVLMLETANEIASIVSAVLTAVGLVLTATGALVNRGNGRRAPQSTTEPVQPPDDPQLPRIEVPAPADWVPPSSELPHPAPPPGQAPPSAYGSGDEDRKPRKKGRQLLVAGLALLALAALIGVATLLV
jgi:hypothetical protein